MSFPSLPLRVLLVTCALSVPPAAAQGLGDYLNVESPQVSPITATSAFGQGFVLVCNTPDNSVELWSVDENVPMANRLLDRLPVGLEPISVLADGDEFWVANFLGDSVTHGRIVATSPSSPGVPSLELLRTVNVGDEPMDLALYDAGGTRTLLVTLHTTSELVWLDPMTLAITATETLVQPSGTPPFALKEPRAVRVSGDRVFVLGCKGGVTHADSLYDLDVLSGDLTAPSASMFDESVAGLGSTNMNMRFAPNGDLFVVGGMANTFDADHIGEVRSAPTGFLTSVLYRRNALTGAVDQRDLNRAGSQLGGEVVDKQVALSNPTDLTILPLSSGETRVLVTAMGSDRIGVLTSPVADVALTAWTRDVIDFPAQTVGGGPRFGPRGMTLTVNQSGADRLYVVNRLDNSLSIFDPIGLTHLESEPLGNDPTPAGVKAGREFIYSAELSGTGFVSCASCHIDARTDALSWRLGNPQGLPPAQNPPSRDFILSLFGAGSFNDAVSGPGGSDSVFLALMYDLESFDPEGVDDKREMVTQSLQGLSTWETRPQDRDLFTTAPFHWRGDKETVGDFNEAFVALLLGEDIGTPGDPRGLTASQVESMEEFVHSIHYPPNPKQPDDRRFSAGPEGGQRGMELFHEKPFQLLADRACVHCHSLPAGTNRRITVMTAEPVEPGFVTQANRQPLETAAMRGLFQKEPLLEPDGRFDQNANTTPRTGHFGLNHQGLVGRTGPPDGGPTRNLTSINLFVNQFIQSNPGESVASPDSHAIKQFVHEFDWGLGPIVGRVLQVRQPDLSDDDFILNVAGPSLALMTEQAREANASLVCWVETPGGTTARAGYRYYPIIDLYVREDASLPTQVLDVNGLIGLLPSPSDSLVFLSVPLGSERRVAAPDGVAQGYLVRTPTNVSLLPMQPNTAYADVPNLRGYWVPTDAPASQTNGAAPLFDFQEFETVSGVAPAPLSGEIFTRLMRLYQYGLMQQPAGASVNDFGVDLLRHEAPRRIRVAASRVVTGARLLLSFPNPGPGYMGLPPTDPTVQTTIARRTIELPLYPTNQFEGGVPIWETAVELEPEIAYELMLGGPDAPGVAQTGESVALHSVELPTGFPGVGPSGTLSGFQWANSTFPTQNVVVEPTAASPMFVSPFDPDNWNDVRIEIRNPGPNGPYDTSGLVSAPIYARLRM